MHSNSEILFLHVPKFSNYYKPLDEFINITYIPMGVFALADMMTRERHCVEIVNLGLEWILDNDFSIIEYLRGDRNLKVVFMPLFWHYQSYDVIRVAETIKKEFPGVYVFLGGFTASYFAAQIVRDFPFIDGVVKGYAEGPVKDLCSRIFEASAKSTAPDFTGVQNLVTSESGEKESCDFYLTSEKDFNSLRFTNLALLKNFTHYIRLFSFPLAYSKNLSMADNVRLNNMGLVMFPIEIGRGCNTECSWCAGSTGNQARMNFRSKIMWRDKSRVVADMKEGILFGYKTFAVCFDPYPGKQQYYLELFEEIRKQNVKCGLYFECYALPTLEFIDSFKKTFDLSRSVVAISPECGSEEVRRKNKGYYFSNADFFNRLDALQAAGIKTDVFFTMGVPHENIKTLMETKAIIDKISAGYKNIGRMMTWGIQMEPGSPMFEKPEEFKIVTDRKTFKDFYNIHSGFHSDTYSALGYSVENYFCDGKTYTTEEFAKIMMAVKCQLFCFLHDNCAAYNSPFWGRMTCRLRALTFWLKGFGLKKYLGRKRPEYK